MSKVIEELYENTARLYDSAARRFSEGRFHLSEVLAATAYGSARFLASRKWLPDRVDEEIRDDARLLAQEIANLVDRARGEQVWRESPQNPAVSKEFEETIESGMGEFFREVDRISRSTSK